MDIKKKRCWFGHRDFKTVKIKEYLFDNKSKDIGYKVKRWITIQRCGWCGKLIMECSND